MGRSALLLFDFTCVALLYGLQFYSAYATFTTVFNHSSAQRTHPSRLIPIAIATVTLNFAPSEEGKILESI